jgi:Ca2+/H+ antiporter, TMEM165/GDT1 family
VELTFEAGSWWSYLLVFLAAATPVLEVLVVIPAGVLAGMPPTMTALVAIAGNLTTVS